MDLEYRDRLEKRFKAEIQKRFVATFNVPKDAGFAIGIAELQGQMKAFDVALVALREESTPPKKEEESQVELTNPYLE